MINLDQYGIHANCDQFQINDLTGSKLVAIDSSQIQIYTNDLSINSGMHHEQVNLNLFYFILDQKRLEIPHLITNSISSDKNLR